MSTTSAIESLQLLLAAAQACDSKKAEDIRILRLDPSESGLTDYFLICHGLNTRQNEAIADEIEIQLKRQFGVYANSVEGRRQAEWVLLDYVDFIVHIFSEEKREFYALERLRKSATSLTIADLEAQLKSLTSPGKSAPAKPAAAKAPAKKAVAKKIVAKKAVATKSAAKKPSAKKVVAKKAIAKKPVKKAAKTAAKKPLKKKVIVKKTAKKATAKKSSRR